MFVDASFQPFGLSGVRSNNKNANNKFRNAYAQETHPQYMAIISHHLKQANLFAYFPRLSVLRKVAIIYDSCCVLLYVMFYFGRISFVFTACTAASCIVHSNHGKRKTIARKGREAMELFGMREREQTKTIAREYKTNSDAQMKYLKSDIKK